MNEVRTDSVVLYTRDGCHLCEQAKRTLERFGFSIIEIDIDTQAVLKEKFDTCVPVVEIDGRIRFRGAVSPLLLGRLRRHLGVQNA